MAFRTLGYRGYVGVFCLTFIVTVFLLKEFRPAPPKSQVVKREELPRSVPTSSGHHVTRSPGNHGPQAKRGRPQPDQGKQPGPPRPAHQPNKCAKGSPQLVILLTYGRSGSSLMSDIISEHPGVFTYFEPLHNLAQSFTKKQTEYLDEHHQYLHLTQIPEYNAAALKILEKQLTCDYHRLNRHATLNLHSGSLESTRPLYYCVKRALTSKAEEKCLLEAQERCEKKPIRFVKTIRLSVESVTSLLDAHPCAKLIYLIRDPRGSYHSKTKMFKSHGANVTWDAARFCTRLDKDVAAVNKLKRKYPHRVHVTRFETVATHPNVSAKLIYDFLGLPFTRKIATFVHKKTHSEVNGVGYNTARANSLEACYKWRRTIPFNYVTAFDNFCKDAYFKLGYLPANSLEDVRDLKKTLIFHRDSFT